MSRDRFLLIQRFLRFDDSGSRRARVQDDLFAAIKKIFELFVSNCILSYTPHLTLTIDEQLLPTKNRCKFIQYIGQIWN